MTTEQTPSSPPTAIRLERFAPVHFDIVATWFPDAAALAQWGGSGLAFPLDRVQLALMAAEEATIPPRRLCRVGILDGAIIGHAQLALDHVNGIARLGRVAIAPQRRGEGLAVPFLDAMIDLAFSMPDIERLELFVYTFNAPALRTYARLGFVPEGVWRSSIKVGDERWDTATQSILRAEYRRLREVPRL